MGAKLKAIFVFLLLSAVFLHSKTRIFAAATCTLSIPNSVYTGTPFTLGFSNVIDKNGNIVTSPADLRVDINGNPSSSALTINNGAGTATILTTLPVGTSATIELKSNGGVDLICGAVKTLTADPAKLPDNRTNPDGSTRGCCTSNSQCVSWYGTGSSCPAAANNYSCQSARQCVGGDPNHIIPAGGDCSAVPAADVYDRCATHVCEAGKCAIPCGTDASCLTKRYPTQAQACDPKACNCNAIISSIELPITDTSASAMSASSCGSSSCFSVRSNSSSNQSLLCYSVNSNNCSSSACSISVSNGQATIDVQCLVQSSSAYSFVISSLDGQTKYSSQSLNVGARPRTNPTVAITNPTSNSQVRLSVIPPTSVTDSASSCSTIATITPNTSQISEIAQAEFALCNQVSSEDLSKCQACVKTGNITDPNDNNQKFWTALGCVSVTKEGIVTSLIRVGIGISGGFVLLSILYGAFLVTTSSGDPKRVQEGQEMITSAIMGLLFVLFSIIILRFIGVSILQIPGFGA